MQGKASDSENRDGAQQGADVAPPLMHRTRAAIPGSLRAVGQLKDTIQRPKTPGVVAESSERSPFGLTPRATVSEDGETALGCPCDLQWSILAALD